MTEFVLTVLGGSSAFTPVMAKSLAEQLPSGRLRVRLWGRNAARLDVVAGLCDRHARHRNLDHQYVGTTDLAAACDGASVVVNQIRFGGWPGRTRDELLPVPFGYPGDETIGPGGLASAVRSARQTLAVVRRVAETAPDAWLLNMANPMGMLLAALERQGAMRSFGLCELPAVTLRRAAAVLGLPTEAVDADYAGINHQGFFTSIRHDGRERLAEILAVIRGDEHHAGFRVDASVMESLGALPLPYYRLYAHRERETAALASRPESRGDELAALTEQLLDDFPNCDGSHLPNALTERATPWIDEALVPAIVALADGPPAELFVSAPNRGSLDFLPDDAVVEQPCTIGADGPQWPASSRPRTTPAIERFLQRVAAFEDLACRASLDPTAATVRAALEAHGFELDADAVAALTPMILAESECGA